MDQRVLTLRDKTRAFIGWLIKCPGCRCLHVLDNRWTFSGDMENPTFYPSLLVNGTNSPSRPRCHSFIQNGTIRFLPDSTHDLAGVIVELPVVSGER